MREEAECCVELYPQQCSMFEGIVKFELDTLEQDLSVLYQDCHLPQELPT